MIDFLKNKGIKAFQEIQEIAERIAAGYQIY